MTTAQEVKRLAATLLKRHDDLVMVGRWIVLTPVRHLLRGIFVDRTSNPNRFRPYWVTFRIFQKIDWIPLGPGKRVYPPSGAWLIGEPNVGTVFTDLMESSALPQLRKIETIENYADFWSGDETEAPDPSASRVLTSLALGLIDEARDLLKEPRPRKIWERRLTEYALDDLLLHSTKPVTPADLARIADTLHEWELYTVTKCRLLPYWERTPFPLEAMLK